MLLRKIRAWWMNRKTNTQNNYDPARAQFRRSMSNYDELMDIIKECQKVAVKAGAESVSAYVKITYRPEGEVLSIEKKVTKHHQ